jgi:hypothetical protein
MGMAFDRAFPAHPETNPAAIPPNTSDRRFISTSKENRNESNR